MFRRRDAARGGCGCARRRTSTDRAATTLGTMRPGASDGVSSVSVRARLCARSLPPPPSFHNRRKTWAVTKSEICRDSCPDMRIAADFCTEFSLELLRKWSVATKNDETHDNNPSPSGAHRGSRLRRFLASLGFLCHGLFYPVSNAPWAAAASWTPRARPSCTAQTPTGTARPRSPESPPVYPHRFATGSGRLAQPPPR